MANEYGLPKGPLLAYLSGRDANQRAGALDTQNAASLMGILAQMQNQKREQQKLQLSEEYRTAITGAKTPDEQLAIASRYMGPDDLGKMIQSSKDRAMTSDNTKQVAMLRLSQQAQRDLTDLQYKAKNSRSKEENEYWDRQIDVAKLGFQKQAADIQAGRYTYETGNAMTPFQPAIPQAGTTAPQGMGPIVNPTSNLQPASAGGEMSGSPTLMSLLQRVSDPAERAGAVSAFSQQGNGAPTAPPAAPAPAPSGGGYNTNNPELRRFGGAAPATPAPSVAPIPTAAVTAPAAPAAAAVRKQLTIADAPAGLTPQGKQNWLLTQERMRSQAEIKADVNLMGGRESVFLNRVLTASNQVNKDLQNIVELPISSSRGLFGGRSQGKSLFEAGKETLATAMTTQEVQSYNTLATGIQRNLAAIESAGLAPPNSLMHMMDAVIFKEGDTNFTKLQKLAQTRQIVEAGLETILTNPRISPEQKKHAQELLDGIVKAVPFSGRDILKLGTLQQTNPGATLKEIMAAEKQGAGAGWTSDKEQRYQELLRKRGGT